MSARARTETVPVLIVGGGAAGLATAIGLARQGVASLLVERRGPRPPAELVRATMLTTRTMELVRGWGLEALVRDGEPALEWLGWIGETAVGTPGQAFPIGLPTRAQAALVSPSGPACVPQDHLEATMLDHLGGFDRARVERGTALVQVDNGPDGVEAVLRDLATGELRVVQARYLVAADGAHGTTRAALGIDADGPHAVGERIAVQFRAPLLEALGDRRHPLFLVTRPDAAGAFICGGRGDRWGYAYEWDPARERLPDHTAALVSRRIRRAAGLPALELVVERIAAVTFTALLAERFRRDSAFLAGDAAHRVTPRGGTGLNAAIQDGVDLAWKLAWVRRGDAEPALLDSYEAERRPLVAHHLARSLEEGHDPREAGRELHADLAGRVAHAWVPGAGVLTLDLVGPGLTLLAGPHAGPWAAAVAGVSGGPPVALHVLDTVSAVAVGVPAGGAVLVRPDAKPAAWFPDGDEAAARLGAAIARLTVGRAGTVHHDAQPLAA